MFTEQSWRKCVHWESARLDRQSITQVHLSLRVLLWWVRVWILGELRQIMKREDKWHDNGKCLCLGKLATGVARDYIDFKVMAVNYTEWVINEQLMHKNALSCKKKHNCYEEFEVSIVMWIKTEIFWVVAKVMLCNNRIPSYNIAFVVCVFGYFRHCTYC